MLWRKAVLVALRAGNLPYARAALNGALQQGRGNMRVLETAAGADRASNGRRVCHRCNDALVPCHTTDTSRQAVRCAASPAPRPAALLSCWCHALSPAALLPHCCCAELFLALGDLAECNSVCCDILRSNPDHSRARLIRAGLAPWLKVTGHCSPYPLPPIDRLHCSPSTSYRPLSTYFPAGPGIRDSPICVPASCQAPSSGHPHVH